MAKETLRPSAVGDETALTPSAGANWECVDEAEPDEGGTTVYHSTVATWKRDLYNLPASSGLGTINSVKVYCRCWEGTANGYAKCILKSNGTVTEGSLQVIINSWVTYSEQWNDNPADSEAWEWADIDALQIGVSLLPAGAASPHCTQVYVEVDYTPEPTTTTKNPDNVLSTSVMGQGTIDNLGDSDVTEWGFEYGLTKTNTWEVHHTGTGEEGDYKKTITGLSANTVYWIRAYAINTEGTGYGKWIEFQTAASGIIPTGTNLFICADLSGYTFKLMKSETDDGEVYTAYFVISTDLTNKQGLSYYKRILDLHLYFRSESSGTVTVEVKRDSEAEWQSVGTVALAGTEDIIVKHLAPDIRAKVFLFKISAANFFRFLGCLFEYLPEEMR